MQVDREGIFEKAEKRGGPQRVFCVAVPPAGLCEDKEQHIDLQLRYKYQMEETDGLHQLLEAELGATGRPLGRLAVSVSPILELQEAGRARQSKRFLVLLLQVVLSALWDALQPPAPSGGPLMLKLMISLMLKFPFNVLFVFQPRALVCSVVLPAAPLQPVQPMLWHEQPCGMLSCRFCMDVAVIEPGDAMSCMPLVAVLLRACATVVVAPLMVLL